MGKHDVEMSPAEQKNAVDIARDLAQEFDKVGAEADAANQFPQCLVPLFKDSGLCGLVVPKRYGGMGADIWTAAQVSRELAKGDPSCALAFNMHTTMVGIFRGLLPEDRQAQWFPQIAQQQKIVCGPFSEERAGLTGLADTTAAPVEGGGFTINGKKTWATLSQAADIISFNACVTEDADGLLPADFQKHIAQEGVFVLPMDTPGIRVVETWDTLGMRATGTQTVVFDDVIAPADALCGNFRGGLFAEFEWAVMTFSGVYQGLIEKAYEETANILRKKSLGATAEGADVALRGLGYVQCGLGRMLVEKEAGARLLEMSCRQLIEGCDVGWDPVARVALLDVAKLVITESASRVVSDGMRLVGGSSFRRGHLLERLYRDARSGPFHPLTTDQIYDYLGRWELGLLSSRG
jgi:alkylation response protein AidB-like acyl-CoA dehydrogenase